MKKLPTEQENPKGLHNRYNITKVSGEVVDENAEYFVLRLDDGGDDIKHIKACRKAVRVYAKKIKKHLPQLSKDILNRYKKSKNKNGKKKS